MNYVTISCTSIESWQQSRRIEITMQSVFYLIVKLAPTCKKPVFDDNYYKNEIESIRLLGCMLAPNKDWLQFARYLRVLEICHQSLVQGTVISKREIYYRDVNLFQRQSIADVIIKRLSSTFDVPRAAFNITAAYNGLVAGPIQFFPLNESLQQHLDSTTIMTNIWPIPDLAFTKDKYWLILIILKFNHFLPLQFCHSARSILIVEKEGKGYPDQATQKLIHAIQMHAYMSNWPLKIYCLVDWDPYGIDIATVYMYGAQNARQMACPSIIPICLPDILLPLRQFNNDPSWLPLSKNDYQTAARLLQLPIIASHRVLRLHLQRMLFLNVKQELEGLPITLWPLLLSTLTSLLSSTSNM
ncbi:Spo11/DNA topoisomerase VI subunit A [Syncephalis fuscata]|nr:Spo11/DNA topoisomerase VI subunit A [Syncephalis fuscata]